MRRRQIFLALGVMTAVLAFHTLIQTSQHTKVTRIENIVLPGVPGVIETTIEEAISSDVDSMMKSTQEERIVHSTASENGRETTSTESTTIYELSTTPRSSNVEMVQNTWIPQTESVNWKQFAYVQYATNLPYLCNSVMTFESLHRLGAKADKLLLYDQRWAVDGTSDRPESKLLASLRDDYGVVLNPIEVFIFFSESVRVKEDRGFIVQEPPKMMRSGSITEW